MTDIFDRLKAPFPPDQISWRVQSVAKSWTPEKGGKGLALCYIDARDVMDRLDEVVGADCWQDEYPTVGTTTVCRISIKMPNGDWVHREDGAGATDVEAEKGSLSDAFKRCAVKWGIGRYLYSIKAPWVQVDEFKKITASELERLYGLLPNAGPSLIQHSLVGQAKVPAKEWSSPSLRLRIPEKHSSEPENAKSWFILEIKGKIDKAPSRDLLAKLQVDNQDIIDRLNPADTHAIHEAFQIRATQFDERNVA